MAEKKIHYSIDNITAKNANINIIYGERSNGKSYQVKHKKGIEHFLETGKRFILLRRYREEITTERVENYFNDVNVAELTHNKYNMILAYQKKIYLAKYDTESGKVYKGEYVGYYCALSQEQIYAGSSWLDVDTIIFEEFMSRTHYLTNEATKLMNFFSTVDRKRGTTTMWLVGNTISRVCPYLSDWHLMDIVKTQSQGTIVTKDIQIDEETTIKLAIEFCESTGRTSFIFGEHADMLNKGTWQVDTQPHLPKSTKQYKRLTSIVFKFKAFMFRADFLQDLTTHECVWYIVPKESSIKDNTIVISDEVKQSDFYYRDIYTVPFHVLDKALSRFRESNIFYCTDQCGTDFKQAIDFTIRK